MSTLFVGDSLFKYLQVDNADVRSFSGGKTEDLLPLMRDVSDFDVSINKKKTFIIQKGTLRLLKPGYTWSVNSLFILDILNIKACFIKVYKQLLHRGLKKAQAISYTII